MKDEKVEEKVEVKEEVKKEEVTDPSPSVALTEEKPQE